MGSRYGEDGYGESDYSFAFVTVSASLSALVAVSGHVRRVRTVGSTLSFQLPLTANPLGDSFWVRPGVSAGSWGAGAQPGNPWVPVESNNNPWEPSNA